jgi:tetratricopeptide (TPR) repeat protein
VRQARSEAGLSLAGVARTDLSRTAIFLIETGKSNPTLPTLELIAERTGKPIDYFLDDELPAAGPGIDFIEIEQLLASEDFERVKELTAHHLAVRLPRADTARLRFLKGLAHIRQADADGAAPLLAGAREYYESVMDKAMAVECLSWEVNVPYLLEDPDALAFAEATLQRCRQLKPVPLLTEVRIMSRIAGIHSFNRDWPEAVLLYEDVVKRLDVLDLNRMAKVFGELGMAYRELGRPELAASYSQKSIALNEMLRDRYSTAAAENNLALALMNMSNYSSAEEHLDRSIELFDGLGRDRGRSQVLLSYAELYFSSGRLEAAERSGTEAQELAANMKERPTEANAHIWLGRVASARGDAKTADEEFTTAISMLESMDNFAERLIQAHATYAEILEQRGDHQAANQHLREVVALSRPDLLLESAREERRQQLA